MGRGPVRPFIAVVVLAVLVVLASRWAADRDGYGATVLLPVGADLQDLVDRHPAGTTFRIAGGVHREQSIRPRDGDVFIGEPGAVLDGSRPLDPDAFERRGSLWVIGGQTQYVYPRQPVMQPGREADGRAEELYADGERLRRVARLDDLGAPGEWYFDQDADEIWMVDAPSSVEQLDTSTVAAAFEGAGVADVTIRDLEVRRYASPAQRGAIDGYRSRGWHLDRVSALDNHGEGIGIGSGMTVERCLVRGNGQLGIGGSGLAADGVPGEPVSIRSCRILDNARLGFDWGWGAGGMKVVQTTQLVVTNTWVSGHAGPGVWFDIDNRDTTACANQVEDNLMGILVEISDGAALFGNAVTRNVHGDLTGPLADLHAAFTVSESQDVEIHHNVAAGQPVGVRALQVDRDDSALRLRGLQVHHNDMAFTRWTGIVVGGEDPVALDASVNRFWSNTHRTSNPLPFRVDDAATDLAGWRAAGHDATGRLLPAGQPDALPAGVPRWTPVQVGPGAIGADPPSARCESWTPDQV